MVTVESVLLHNSMSKRARKSTLSYITPLGAGTYGEVHLAWCSDDEELVAVKTIRDVTTLWREIHALQKMKGVDNVVQLRRTTFDWTRSSTPLLVMEHGGDSLVNVLDRWHSYGWFDNPGTALHPYHRVCVDRLAVGLLRGLKNVHTMGYAHRDLVPANVLVRDLQLKIADFGMATPLREPDQDEPYTSEVVTVYYRAPELFQDPTYPYDPQAIDLWSAGAILAELVLGEPVFKSWLHPGHKESALTRSGFLDRITTVSKTLAERLKARAPATHYVDVIVGLLNFSPSDRWSATKAFELIQI